MSRIGRRLKRIQTLLKRAIGFFSTLQGVIAAVAIVMPAVLLLLGAVLPTRIQLIQFASDENPIVVKNDSFVPVNIKLIRVVLRIYGGEPAKKYGRNGFFELAHDSLVGETMSMFETRSIRLSDLTTHSANSTAFCKLPDKLVDKVTFDSPNIYATVYAADDPGLKTIRRYIKEDPRFDCAIQVDYDKDLYFFSLPEDSKLFDCSGLVRTNVQEYSDQDECKENHR